MDEDRRIRFLVAPMLFVASLLLGALSDQTARDFIVQTLKNPDWSKLIGLIAGGGVVVFAVGYIIGTVTYFVLRLLFRYRPQRWGKSRFHEVALSDDAFFQVWTKLGASGMPDRWQELFAGVAFDHGVLRESPEGVHRWLFRRWNAFNIATTSFCGLILSFPFGHFIGIPCSLAWYFSVGAFAAILVFVMVWAWRDTMNMADFMARLPPKESKPKNTSQDTASIGRPS
jgi:phosphotransferase system  glucose/maltose/N-acetylglucosamine-specific IIC component